MSGRLLILDEQEEDYLRWALHVWEDTFRGVADDHVVAGRFRYDAIFRQLDGKYTEEQEERILNAAVEINTPQPFKKPAGSPPGAS